MTKIEQMSINLTKSIASSYSALCHCAKFQRNWNYGDQKWRSSI